MEEFVRTEVFDVALFRTPSGVTPAVLLIDSEERVLPIFIDNQQALSIKMGVEGGGEIPLTHDLMMNVFKDLDVKVSKATIYDVVEDRYCAKVSLDVKGVVRDVECRSSDAIALAVRAQAPIYVAKEIMSEGAVKKSSLFESKEEET